MYNIIVLQLDLILLLQKFKFLCKIGGSKIGGRLEVEVINCRWWVGTIDAC